ncbi:MAG: hypothetical protein QOI95_3535 [Acidimicrobiaceae bacterium]
MLRLLVNATERELDAARAGPIRWDVAVHGALRNTPFAAIEVRTLPRRPWWSTRAVKARLRRHGPRSAAAADAPPPSLPTLSTRTAPPARSLTGFKARAEHRLRVALETDVLSVPADVDMVFSHLRGVRSRRNVPVIRSTNGVIPEAWLWRGTVDDRIRHFHPALERALAYRADMVLCWTEYGADNLVRAGVDAERVHVVPPVLDLVEPQPMALGETDRVRAVFIGEDAELKGLPEVLAAVASIPSIELHVIGPPQPVHTTEGTCWHGRLSPGQASGVLAQADLLVVPAHVESFGVTHLEAMRHAVTVVGSTIGTTSEIVGDAGVLVPPGDVAALRDALSALAADRSERDRYGRAGRMRYEERYVPAVAAARLEQLLTS